MRSILAMCFNCVTPKVIGLPYELDSSADLVYTGRGALCWLHDLAAWAAVVARLLKPGGVVHILDDHPVSRIPVRDNRRDAWVWMVEACAPSGVQLIRRTTGTRASLASFEQQHHTPGRVRVLPVFD